MGMEWDETERQFLGAMDRIEELKSQRDKAVKMLGDLLDLQEDRGIGRIEPLIPGAFRKQIQSVIDECSDKEKE